MIYRFSVTIVRNRRHFGFSLVSETFVIPPTDLDVTCAVRDAGASPAESNFAWAYELNMPVAAGAEQRQRWTYWNLFYSCTCNLAFLSSPKGYSSRVV